jgi:type II secretion system protein N
MTDEIKTGARWPRFVGYPAFFLIAFVVFFHLTLPFDAIKVAAIEAARTQGYALSMVSLGPSLGFGVTAKGVSLATIKPDSAKPDSDKADPNTPSGLYVDALTAKPSLFPLGVGVSATAFGGELSGKLGGIILTPEKGTPSGGLPFSKLDGLTFKNLELTRAGLKSLVGLDIQGTISGEADLTKLNDLPKAGGTFKLSGKDLVLVGGTINYIDLPKIQLGVLDAKLKVDTGKASIDKLSLGGGDVEANGEGDITLNNRFNASQTKVKIEFKPNEEWLKKKDNSFIQMGLSAAGRPDSKGFYTVNLDGMLGNLRPTLKQ